jgi:fatty-acyl-CoA synthase/long-chain acyl-CoA synthetase
MQLNDELHGWNAVLTLGDLLWRAAVTTPARAALVMPDARYTYQELADRSVDVARGLLALGVRRGDRVGVLAYNGIELLEGIFGSALVGAVSVPINARHRTSELDYIIQNSELVALLTLGRTEGAYLDFPALLADALPGLNKQADPTALGLADWPRLRSVVTLSGAAPPGFLGRDGFDALAADVDHADVHRARMRVRVRDAAMILYTSGTTANPKGCVLSHEAVTRGAEHRARTRYGTGDHDVTWGAGPLFHIGSLAPFIGSVGAGGTYLTDVYFEPGRAIQLMRDEQATVAFPWFPAIIQPILDHPTFDAGELSSIRTILVIGPRALVERVQTTFPAAEMIAACGMTETAGIYAVSDRTETVEERCSGQGKAALGVELRIVDPETGADLPDGEVGEILVRGHCVMTEYHGDPQKTAATLDPDGWLHTGDLYSRAPDGRVTFHGRAKDMLKVGGENVAALEIEDFLCRHPAVRMASVIGRADPRLDEVPVAFVELEAGQALSAEELIDFCAGKISKYKIPAEVHFIAAAEWPMSTTKIDKRGLRARLDRNQPTGT